MPEPWFSAARLSLTVSALIGAEFHGASRAGQDLLFVGVQGDLVDDEHVGGLLRSG